MFAKLICSFLAFCVFVCASAITPEELQTLYDKVDTIIKSNEHEAQIEIRSYIIPMEKKITNANRQVLANLTEGAQAYWNKIAALEKQAESESKNIKSCVELGNNQLYRLNNTVVLPLFGEIAAWHDVALAFLTSCSNKAYDQAMASVELGQEVNSCTDNDCAAILSTEVIALYSNSTQIINDAINDAENYVNVEIDGFLAEVTFDSAAYVTSWTPFLKDVEDCASAITPEELQTLYDKVDTIIKSNEHEAQIEIRSYIIPMEKKITNANRQVLANLTEGAQAYWNKIAALEKQAESESKNIKSCVELGNNQLYRLNNTVVLPLFGEIAAWHDVALAFLTSCSNKAYDQAMASVELGQEVNSCTDNDCAAILSTEVIALYSNSTQIINDAINDAENYVNVEIDGFLAEVTFDSAAYVTSWTPFLKDVEDCVSNL